MNSMLLFDREKNIKGDSSNSKVSITNNRHNHNNLTNPKVLPVPEIKICQDSLPHQPNSKSPRNLHSKLRKQRRPNPHRRQSLKHLLLQTPLQLQCQQTILQNNCPPHLNRKPQPLLQLMILLTIKLSLPLMLVNLKIQVTATLDLMLLQRSKRSLAIRQF